MGGGGGNDAVGTMTTTTTKKRSKFQRDGDGEGELIISPEEVEARGDVGTFRLKRLISSYTLKIRTDAGAMAIMRGTRPLINPPGPLSAINARYSDLRRHRPHQRKHAQDGVRTTRDMETF